MWRAVRLSREVDLSISLEPRGDYAHRSRPSSRLGCALYVPAAPAVSSTRPTDHTIGAWPQADDIKELRHAEEDHSEQDKKCQAEQRRSFFHSAELTQ